MYTGKDEAYKNMRVTCLIATIPDSPDNPVAQKVGAAGQS